jgi:hypothetical protein
LINTHLPRVALASVLCLGLAAAAAAQDRRPAPGGDRQKPSEDRNLRREQRLHDLLQIKPDQEGAFRTFVAALEQARPERGRGRDRGPQGGAQGQAAPLTTPERLDRQAQGLAEAQQRLQKTSAAVKTFYAALTPEQRKAFDAMPVLIRTGDEGRGPGGRFMFMRRGPGPGPGPGSRRRSGQGRAAAALTPS